MIGTDASVRVGFFGKLPSRGDFVRFGLSREVATAWDDWWRSALPAQAQRLGAWRFALAPGLCGARALTGVWLPSADRVGRAFPLLIAAEGAAATPAFLDAAERIGTGAIDAAETPEMLALHLSRAPSPLPFVKVDHDTPARWWRISPQAVYSGELLPDAETMALMLTP